MTRTALVTGAASGIGLACAERLRAADYALILTDLDQANGREAARRLGATFIAADLETRAGCQTLVEATLAACETVHVLVNNAGFQKVAALEEFPEATWDRMLALMLTAPFLLTRALWPAMKRQRWGRIVNIASVHSLVASPFKVGYVAAKHGLLGLTRTAALEGGPHGITANAICPAYVRTPLVDRQIADQAREHGLSAEEVLEKVMLAPAAVKRLIEPAEVAEAVAFLCSDAGGVITGAALTMDLGWTAR